MVLVVAIVIQFPTLLERLLYPFLQPRPSITWCVHDPPQEFPSKKAAVAALLTQENTRATASTVPEKHLKPGNKLHLA